MSKARFLSYGLMFVLATMVGCGDGDGDGGGAADSTSNGGSEPAAAAAGEQEPDPNGGTVVGTIAFEGTAPERKPMRIMLQTTFCEKHHKGTPPLIETVIVNDNQTLKNVVVSITGLKKGKWKAPSEPVVLDQVGCMYIPHVVAKQGNQALQVKNSDNTNHNIKAEPEVRGNGAFNVSQARRGMKTNVTKLKRPENVFVSCNVHSWMGAWICVFDHPFFVVTGDDGTYKLPAGIPPGTYTVEAWHEKLGKQTAEVEVKAGETTTVDLTFKAE